MDGLDLAGGFVWGRDTSLPPLPPAPPGISARQALEDAVRRPLERSRCVVSFSGGRDSSAVLALATLVARREGLPLPVPVSQRFPSYADADEDSWQELVVRHVGLVDWVRLTYESEMDVIGPIAQEVLTTCGVLWPMNAHFHLPVAECATGGIVLTGFGGDELLTMAGTWRRVNLVLGGHCSWRARDLARICVAYGPSPLRRLVLRRRHQHSSARRWLRPEADRALTEAAIDHMTNEPVRWDDSVTRSWWASRYRTVAESSLERVGRMRNATVVSPLTDPVVLACLAREGGRSGFRSRTEAMNYLFGDLLPPEVTSREGKAMLTGAFWTDHARAFVRAWDGTGVDPEVVDVDVLRTMWSATDEYPDARTQCLLQAAWLSTRSPSRPRSAA